jgi:hypothetical protein
LCLAKQSDALLLAAAREDGKMIGTKIPGKLVAGALAIAIVVDVVGPSNMAFALPTTWVSCKALSSMMAVPFPASSRSDPAAI